VNRRAKGDGGLSWDVARERCVASATIGYTAEVGVLSQSLRSLNTSHHWMGHDGASVTRRGRAPLEREAPARDRDCDGRV
jgi:hypothetical protein